MTEPAAAGFGELPRESLPSRHQRRILICAEPEPAGHPYGQPGLHPAAARWQRQYVGGVYVRVPGGTGPQQRAAVARFTAAGCTLQATHFYRPADVPALAPLARLLETLPVGDGFDPLRVAELLVLGATDVVGPYPQQDLAAARAAVSYVNDRLGDNWLALPMVTRVEGATFAAGGPQTQHPAQDALDDHFADTARALAAEAESRLEVLERLTGHGPAVPHPTAALGAE
ncbi:hypothetical protein [Streptomyces sp. NBC_00239]|uniref:hypothetical protein n=1 Tax=Streptomyces sp. NBC_00239 TaxID=2903640 RepID=UPI002E2B3324|nr:hypothetical protein [Streptomyces sp. NBC_00239]